ncbi:hypothetical protein QFZ38_004786 [Pseudomonas cedrina]|nr:hypothetical protein [Pseudomonas cedrina]
MSIIFMSTRRRSALRRCFVANPRWRFISLTLSVFCSSLAFVLMGSVLVGTVLALLFLPVLFLPVRCSVVLGREKTKVVETSHIAAG